MNVSVLESSHPLYAWITLPALIFVARICDVTIGTVRIVMTSRGNKNLAPLLGFFEVLIWIVVVGEVFKQVSNVACYVAWAGGFATGNRVGLWLEEKIALGSAIVRIISSRTDGKMLEILHANNIGYTLLDGQGYRDKVKVVFIIIPRNQLSFLEGLIRETDQDAFYSVEDVRMVRHGIFPSERNLLPFARKLFPTRKAK